MPFDPKVIRQDEEWLEQSELELPDDLELLGEQLCDDAQRLAACYPSASTLAPEIAAAAVPSRAGRRILTMSSVLAGAAALGLLAAVTAQLAFRDFPPHPGVAIRDTNLATYNAPLALRTAPAKDQPLDAVPHSQPDSLLTPAGFSGATPTISPALLGQGITSPEMEGWMDLRQNDLAMDAESIEF